MMLPVLDRENLHSASGRRVVAGDKDADWGSSRVSDWATSFLVVCQLPPECNQCDNDVFADDVKMLSPRCAPSTVPGIVRCIAASLPIPQNAIISLLGGLIHFNYPLPVAVRAIPYGSQTLKNTGAFSWLVPSHPPSIGCSQSKLYIVNDIRDHVCPPL